MHDHVKDGNVVNDTGTKTWVNFRDRVKAIEFPEIVKPIEKDEIQYARSIIRQMHPLRNLSYYDCVPLVAYVYDTVSWATGTAPKPSEREEKISLAGADQLKED